MLQILLYKSLVQVRDVIPLSQLCNLLLQLACIKPAPGKQINNTDQKSPQTKTHATSFERSRKTGKPIVIGRHVRELIFSVQYKGAHNWSRVHILVIDGYPISRPKLTQA